MSHKQVIDNLFSVKGEVNHILDNIEAVRGSKHKMLTMAFLHGSTMTDVVRIFAESSRMPDDVQDQLRDVYLLVMKEMISAFTSVAQLGPEEIESAIEEAMAVEKTVHSMTRSAVRRGEKGEGFGG